MGPLYQEQPKSPGMARRRLGPCSLQGSRDEHMGEHSVWQVQTRSSNGMVQHLVRQTEASNVGTGKAHSSGDRHRISKGFDSRLH
jgi:hypothetical protein